MRDFQIPPYKNNKGKNGANLNTLTTYQNISKPIIMTCRPDRNGEKSYKNI